MQFFRRVRRKIEEGFLQELMEEARWMWRYIRRYRVTVLIHILLGVSGILMGLGTSIASQVGAVINIRVKNEIQAEVYQHILDTDWESLEQYRS